MSGDTREGAAHDLTLGDALLLLRCFIHGAIGQSDECEMAHLALDRVVAECAAAGMETSS